MLIKMLECFLFKIFSNLKFSDIYTCKPSLYEKRPLSCSGTDWYYYYICMRYDVVLTCHSSPAQCSLFASQGKHLVGSIHVLFTRTYKYYIYYCSRHFQVTSTCFFGLLVATVTVEPICQGRVQTRYQGQLKQRAVFLVSRSLTLSRLAYRRQESSFR